MPAGIMLYADPSAANGVDDVVSQAARAHTGNCSLWRGLGAPEPERQAFGASWPNTIPRLREHLTVLRSIFTEGAVDFHGDELTASPGGPVAVPGGGPPPG